MIIGPSHPGVTAMADTDSARLTIRLNANDNVVTARAELLPGTAVPGEAVTVAQPIPSGHKVATRAIAKGEAVRKYDQIIGFASDDIAVGEHVHVHNVEMHEIGRATSELQSLMRTSYAVFRLKNKN